MVHIKSIFLLFVLSILFACGKEEDKVIQTIYYGYEYAPLKIGSSKVYQVDSIVYDDFDIILSVDTFSYKVKEELIAEFKDASNRTSFKVGRYLQMDTAHSWKLNKVFSYCRTNTQLEKFEDNFRSVSLIFPVKEDESWDANSMNTHSQQNYEYEEVHFPYNLGNLHFDSCIKVLQLEEENLLQQYHQEETYATGIGLIEKTSRMIETDLQGNIQRGHELSYRIISY